MLKIYLCEDEKTQLEHWKQIISKYLLMHEINMELFCWADKPDKLLGYLESEDSPGLYFLDIDLKAEMNGLDLAREIRKRDPRGYLVFITTHDEMAPFTFKLKVEAMDFILKDEPECLEARIIACMEAAAANYHKYLETTYSCNLYMEWGPAAVRYLKGDIRSAAAMVLLQYPLYDC